MPGSSHCYHIANATMFLSGKLENYCHSIYGGIAEPQSVQATINLFRIIVEMFVQSRNHYDVEREFKEIIGDGKDVDLFIHGLPLCERKKSMIYHKYLIYYLASYSN